MTWCMTWCPVLLILAAQAAIFLAVLFGPPFVRAVRLAKNQDEIYLLGYREGRRHGYQQGREDERDLRRGPYR